VCGPLHNVGIVGRTAGRLCARSRAAVIAETYSPGMHLIIRSESYRDRIAYGNASFLFCTKAAACVTLVAPENGSAPTPPNPGHSLNRSRSRAASLPPRRGPAAICGTSLHADPGCAIRDIENFFKVGHYLPTGRYSGIGTTLAAWRRRRAAAILRLQSASMRSLVIPVSLAELIRMARRSWRIPLH
jgi:hypothetical protein